MDRHRYIAGRVEGEQAPERGVMIQRVHAGAWLLLGILTLGGLSGCANSGPRHSILDLGPLPGYNASHALGINASGQVVGFVEDANGDFRAVLWSHGKSQDLGTLGGKSSKAWAINEGGQIVGESFLNNDSTRCPFFWHRGPMHPLDSTKTFQGTGFAINRAGQAVGQHGGSSSSGTSYAFLCSGGKMVDLPTGGAQGSCATSINSAGEVVGWSLSADVALRRACRWKSGRPDDLGTPPGDRSWASAINDNGDVAGSWQPEVGDTPSPNAYYHLEVVHAFLLQHGRMHDLDTLKGGLSSEANALNNLDQVVGQADTGSGETHAVLWQKGRLYDLNTLIPKESGWILQEATGINDTGQICGTGILNGAPHAFLLTPYSRS